MSAAQEGAGRATVRVVGGDNIGGPAASGAAPEPESLPPSVAAPPPQELEHDVGGPVIPAPSPEDLAAGSGGSVADRMRARFHAMAATEEFGVPGWELDDGRPGMIVEAKAFSDRKKFNEGLSNELYIVKSTHRLFFVNDDGSREEIAGGWGPKLASMIGVPVQKATDLVAMVISKPDPGNPEGRIPNVAGIGSLATEMINWARSGQRRAEEDLGE